MKTSHEASGRRRREAKSQPAALVAHSSRRAQAARRRQLTSPISEPAALYRRYNPLAIESTDDRRAFRLLLAPFVALALIIAVLPVPLPVLRHLVVATEQVQEVSPASLGQLKPAVAVLVTAGAGTSKPLKPAAPAKANTALLKPLADLVRTGAPTPLGQSRTPVQIAIAAAPRIASVPPERAATAALAVVSPPRALVAAKTTARAAPAKPIRPTATNVLGPPQELPPASLAGARQPAILPKIALLQAPDISQLVPVPSTVPEVSCAVTYTASNTVQPLHAWSGLGQSFGQRLAHAAAAQTQHFVIYDDTYRHISPAGGDVPALFGVCTDVVIRAYRALGIDLQSLVQAAHVGSGDPSIDHRRTEVLRRFFTHYGLSLPVTGFAEDYAPGDIVTYWRPQNSGSRSHIAVVADRLGPSGRPMIIHNRGWGPQLEDALFVDRITGHYRYSGPSPAGPRPQVASTRARPFQLRPVATPVTMQAPTATNSATAPRPAGF